MVNKTQILKKRAKERQEGLYNTSTNNHLNLPQGVTMFKPELGKKGDAEYDFDFITYIVKSGKHPDGVPPGETWFRVPFYKHSGIGGDSTSFTCPRTFKKECFLCSERNRLFSENADKTLTDNLRASYRELYIMLNLDDEYEVMEMAYKNFGKKFDRVISKANGKETGFFEHSSKDGGHTVKALFIEEKYGSLSYPVLDEIEFEPREDIDIDPEEVPCLESMLVIPSNIDMKKAYYDMDEDEIKAFEDEGQEDDNSDRKPVRRRRKRNDSNEEDEEKQSGDETEEKRSRRRRPSKTEEDKEEDKEKGDDETNQDHSKCPEGLEYGVSIDEDHDECENCLYWKDCREEADKNKSANEDDKDDGDEEEPSKRKSRRSRRRK